MAYQDMRHYMAVLEEQGLLHRVKKEVDKDWEVAAVCRRVFQRVPTANRPALLFEKVKGYDIPIVAGILGASPRVNALALETTVDQITDKWAHAERNPIAPVVVSTGPVKENILKGDRADLNRIPIPTWTVEHDPAPFLTSPFVVTADPETGERNVGTYRQHVKGPRRLGMCMSPGGHGLIHVQKYEALGKPAPIAICLGCDPTVGLTSVSKFKLGADEFAIAGGLRGAPLELVRCETVPLEVPAAAEIVIEGWVPNGLRELEGPFGEYTGFMGKEGNRFVIEISCITHRNSPIYQAFISQMPPSESSCIRGIGREKPMLNHLKETLRLPVQDLYLPEPGGAAGWLVISVKKTFPGVVAQVVNAAWGYGPRYGKFMVIVDEDVDVRDSFQVQWAMAFCTRPDQDIHIHRDTAAITLDPSNAPWDALATDPRRHMAAKVCIDATRKHAYPPKAVPPREHLEQVDRDWHLYGFGGSV